MFKTIFLPYLDSKRYVIMFLVSVVLVDFNGRFNHVFASLRHI